MVNKLELEIAMIRKNKTKREVAKEMGISRMSLYEKINGRSPFKISEINKLCEILNLDGEMRNKIFFFN